MCACVCRQRSKKKTLECLSVSCWRCESVGLVSFLFDEIGVAVAMQSHRKRKPGPSRKHAVYASSDDEYDEVPLDEGQRRLPRFNFDGSFEYGDALSHGHHSPPSNKHFVPRYSKLRKAGGKSITFYEKWRKMQYDMNCVMKRYCEVIGINLSVLPPCTNYDLWRKPQWRKSYDKPLDEVSY